MEIEEFIARAICEADFHQWPDDDYNGRAQRQAYAKMARAATYAVREWDEDHR